MNQQLNEQAIPAFLQRFNGFGDSVVNRVDFSYAEKRRVRVTLEAVDRELNDSWVTVVIVAFGVAEFCLMEDNRTCVVVSDPLVVRWMDGKMWIDFASNSNDNQTPDDFRASDFYFCAEQIEWRVEPISAS